MDYRERGTHAGGVYPTQYTSRMGAARADTRMMQESSNHYGRKERGHEEEMYQTRPIQR